MTMMRFNRYFILFFFSLFLCSPVMADHWSDEVSRLTSSGGLVESRQWKSNAEAQGDFECPGCAGEVGIGYTPCVFGETCAQYNSSLDGFQLAIVGDTTAAHSLEVDFDPVTTTLWAQWEMYIDGDFHDDLPIIADDDGKWVNTKLFRFYNYARTGACQNKNSDTLFIGCDLSGTVFAIDWEDTDDMDCNGAVVPVVGPGSQSGLDDYVGKWLRWSYFIDFSTQNMKTWVTDPSTGSTTLMADVTRSSYDAPSFDGIAALIHSTSRSHHYDSSHPTYAFVYRNLIVADETINFYTESGGDVTPPAVSFTTSSPQNITSDTLAISGTASDAVGVSTCKWRINSPPDDSNGTALSGTTAWSGTASGFTLGGQDTLYAGCTDAAGNWGTDTITVNYQGTSTGGLYFTTNISDTNEASATPDCTDYDPDTDACGAGSEDGYATMADLAQISLGPGADVYLHVGDIWAETMTLAYNGTESDPIIVGQFGTGDAPVVKKIAITGDWVQVSDIEVDANKGTSDAVTVQSADYVTLDGITAHDGKRDGFDIEDSDHLTMIDCAASFFLNGTHESQSDAHGLVMSDCDQATVTNFTAFNVSGDCFQIDPNRAGSGTITLTNPTCYSTALLSDWYDVDCSGTGEGWCTGDKSIENFLDVKNEEIDGLLSIIVNGGEVYGLDDTTFISNPAAFNIKEFSSVTVNGTKIHDCYIAFRLRGDGGNGNPQPRITNSIVYDCTTAVRAEDNVATVDIWANTFGDGITTFFDDTNTMDYYQDWSVLNNGFAGTLPTESPFDNSYNIQFASGDVVDYGNHDYTPDDSNSALYESGAWVDIPLDASGNPRQVPIDIGYKEISFIAGSTSQSHIGAASQQ